MLKRAVRFSNTSISPFFLKLLDHLFASPCQWYIGLTVSNLVKLNTALPSHRTMLWLYSQLDIPSNACNP